MKKFSVSVFGDSISERCFDQDSSGMAKALVFIQSAMIRGDSISIDVVDVDTSMPDYLKDYVSP